MLNGELSEQPHHDETHWTEVWTLESPAEPALCGLCCLSQVPRKGDEPRKDIQKASPGTGHPQPLNLSTRPRRRGVHSQGWGLLGVAADRQESTPDLQLADNSEELTQRETTTGCEGKGGHVHLHNKVSISPEERPPWRPQMCPK